ncbi:MAG TPA: Cof-type HAD-IIB family hydrolase [Terriglobales bacterium]|nr:Cof-type HAD-IIB family hydrolase [Terriglobales bacterium]
MADNIRLVIADVDGTLVTQNKILTPRAIEAVQRLWQAGIAFSITSGRPPLGMQMLIAPLALTEPIAAFNGGVLVRPDLSVISQSFVPADTGARVIEAILRHGLDVWVYTDRDWLVRDASAAHVAREQWTVKFAPTVVPDFAPHLDRVAKIVGISDDLPAVAACEADVQRDSGNQVSAARSQPYYLDVTHPDANKGHVVTALSELLSIPPAQIATIGDMPNDVLMFRKSGLSIAMGNASADVQRQAQFVTTSNEEEGFAKAMEKLILGSRGENIGAAS